MWTIGIWITISKRMDFFVIRSKKKLDELYDLLKQRSLPMKIAVQEVFPLRSLEANSYYWGVILYYISEYTGHTPEECHEGYRRMFNYSQEFMYNRRTRQYQFKIRAGTTVVDEHAFYQFIFKVRADAELELHITIPLPNENFIPELNFQKQQKKL